MSPVGQFVAGLFNLINILVLLWCLLSWFPNIRWYDQPFKTLDDLVRPFIAPFRKLIPPIGNIDISPMIAMICLQVVGNIVISFLR